MQKAADDMRLDSWVIDALETDNFERIGPSVYAKGHLRKYAGLLGLPPDEILAAYASLASAPSLSTAPQPGVRMRASTAPVNNFPWVGIAGAVLAVLVLVGIYLWKPWHQRGAGVPPIAMQPAAPSAAASSPQPAASPSEPASGTPAAAPVAATPATASAMPVSARDSAAPIPAVLRTPAAETDTAGSGRARLRLSFSADSWVDVRDKSGHRVFAGFGHANSVKIIAGDAPMRVYLGVVGGVQLQINERAVAIGPQFVTGDVARFEAGADGVLRRDSRVVRPHG
jgi:cytoskeleton protein RodZ